MIFGIHGVTQSDELTKFDVKDIEEHGDIFVVKNLQAKNNDSRTFTIEDDFAGYLRKYINLRPSTVSTSRFFLSYRKGKCFDRPLGRNKILETPKVIAKFLNLPEPENFTFCSFRKTTRKSCVTLLVDNVADTLTLKRQGGWRVSSVEDDLVEEPIVSKQKVTKKLNLPRTKQSMATCTITSNSAATTESAVTSTVTSTQSIVTPLPIRPPTNYSAVHPPIKPDEFHMQFYNWVG